MRNEAVVQVYKHCGNRVVGVPVGGAAGGGVKGGSKLPIPSPLAYRFTCNGPGDHGDGDEGREWFDSPI